MSHLVQIELGELCSILDFCLLTLSIEKSQMGSSWISLGYHNEKPPDSKEHFSTSDAFEIPASFINNQYADLE
jgi:hypothetical protein